jgi:hypothetical protein
MRRDMDEGPEDDRPSRGLVECDITVERNDTIEWSPSKDGDEIAANRKKDKSSVNVKNECCCTSSSCNKDQTTRAE